LSSFVVPVPLSRRANHQKRLAPKTRFALLGHPPKEKEKEKRAKEEKEKRVKEGAIVFQKHS